MLKSFFGLCFLSFSAVVWGQNVRIVPLNADGWTFQAGKVEFLPAAPGINGVTPQGPAMRIGHNAGPVVARNIDFSEGVIDFDIQPTDSTFASFNFHWQDAKEMECFYFRTDWGSGHPDRMEAVQYTPIIGGVNCWKLMPYYQGNASFRQDTWNHVRLVIVGRQMLIYVNSDTRPTLAIPRLEGNPTHGSFSFGGQMTVAHLTVGPVPSPAAGWLSGPEGYDPTDNDPRYLRHWQVTQPDTLPLGVDFSENLMPGKQTAWSPIQAERRGLINLVRKFGGNNARRPDGSRLHKIVWLKTTLQAEREGIYKMRLGFTDDIWVFINGKFLYSDRNHFNEPNAKPPAARVSLDNSILDLPLKAGVNEVLIGVGNKYDWGIVARLDNATEVKIEGQ